MLLKSLYVYAYDCSQYGLVKDMMKKMVAMKVIVPALTIAAEGGVGSRSLVRESHD